MLTLALIGLVGGAITGVSPCVLPVLPVIFLSGGAGRGSAAGGTRRPTARQAAPARRRPYAVVAGLALSFTLFTLLGTLVLSALPLPQDVIRWAGLAALVVLGGAMLFPPVERAGAAVRPHPAAPGHPRPRRLRPRRGAGCGVRALRRPGAGRDHRGRRHRPDRRRHDRTHRRLRGRRRDPAAGVRARRPRGRRAGARLPRPAARPAHRRRSRRDRARRGPDLQRHRRAAARRSRTTPAA